MLSILRGYRQYLIIFGLIAIILGMFRYMYVSHIDKLVAEKTMQFKVDTVEKANDDSFDITLDKIKKAKVEKTKAIHKIQKDLPYRKRGKSKSMRKKKIKKVSI